MNLTSIYWPALVHLPLGPVRMKKALAIFGSPQAVWEAPLSGFREIEGVAEGTLSKIQDVRARVSPEQEMEKLIKNDVQVLTIFDDGYPKLLKEIYDPPVVLFYKGQLAAEQDRAMAVVGTRLPTRYGKTMTAQLCTGLVESGFVIVSGLARGIDTEAHQTALAAKGRTWAVLGCGLDVIYPPENRALRDAMLETGAIISELPLGTPPLAEHFPGRNRIITGLSRGVLIVQSKNKGGSMISARFALEQNREVFAVPGNVDVPQSEGTHFLIKQGAKLVENLQDILDEFQLLSPSVAAPQSFELTFEETALYDLLSPDPVHFDKLVTGSGLSISAVAEILFSLEWKNAVKGLPGRYYVRA